MEKKNQKEYRLAQRLSRKSTRPFGLSCSCTVKQNISWSSDNCQNKPEANSALETALPAIVARIFSRESDTSKELLGNFALDCNEK